MASLLQFLCGITPRTRFLVAILALVGTAIVTAFFPGIEFLWWPLAGALLALAILDALLLALAKKPELQRTVPTRFALGVESEVAIRLRNPNRFPITIELFDGIPQEARCDAMPWFGKIDGGDVVRIHYPVTLSKRGDLKFVRTHLRLRSPLALWQLGWQSGTEQLTRVFPNYEPIIRLALLAMKHEENQMGIVKRQVIGVSREFLQLREYQEGDSLNQIDWKASSRMRQLISREYEEQRNQIVIFLLDCGRRMRSLDNGIPQFDHCLNSMLLLSYLALKQGDQVGVLGFASDDNRWLPPVKGGHSMNTILHHLYNYETSAQASDIAEAVRTLHLRQKRRALIVVLTNLRGEDGAEMETSLTILRKKHLVLLASLREESIDEKLTEKVTTHEQALNYASAQIYAESRRDVLYRLRQHGVLTLDTVAKTLPIALSNQYLEIKKAGRL